MLYDSNLQLLTSASVSIDAGSENVFPIRIECRTGYFLSASAVEDLTVFARVSGETDWTNIETNPLDLSEFNGEIKDFEIKITSANVTNVTDRNFALSVSAL